MVSTLNDPGREAIKSIPDELDDTLLSSADIMISYLENGRKHPYYQMYKRSLWHWARDMGLVSEPDNAHKDTNGKIILDSELKPALKGQISMWYGKTWKQKLNDYDAERKVEIVFVPKQRLRNWLLIPVFCLCSLAWLGFSFTTNDDVVLIFKREGALAAINAYVGREKSMNSFVDLAFFHKINGDLEKAMGVLSKPLQSDDLRARGRALSLMTEIYIYQNRFKDAEAVYNRAIEIFNELRIPENLAHLNLIVSDMHIIQGEPDLALSAISLAEDFYGSTLAIKKQYAKHFFEIGEYQLSAEFSLSLQNSDNVTEVIHSCLHLASCYLRMNDYPEALFYVNKADALIQSTGNEVLRHYSFVQRIHLSNCQGVDSTSLEQVVLNWAHKADEVQIIKVLRAHPCN